MNNREIVRQQFNHKETAVIPYDLIFEAPLIEKINQALGSNSWLNKKEAFFVTAGSFDSWSTFKPQPDGAYIDAYGSVWTQNGLITHLDKPAISGISIDGYTLPSLGAFCNDSQFESMRNKLADNPDLYPVINIGGGIYELAWRLLGVEEALVLMIDGPAAIMRLFDKLTELIFQFIDKGCELPVEAVLLGDDWADQRGIIFGPARWRDMVKPFYKQIYGYIHSKGKIAITHSCGSVREIIPDLIECGLDVLESLQPEARGMDAYEIKREFGRDLNLWGGLGCQSAVTFYTPEKLREEIRRLRAQMSAGGGYILAPSKTLNITVPVENALAVLEEFTSI